MPGSRRWASVEGDPRDSSTYVAVGELFGGSPNPDSSTYVAVGELFGGSPNPDSSTYVAVGELFGGSLSTSVLLEELVEFVCG